MLTIPGKKDFYTQNLKGLFDYELLTETEFLSAKKECEPLVDEIQERGKHGHLPMIESVFWTEDIARFEAVGTFYRRFHSVVIIGMGGATSGGKTLSSLFQSWLMSDSSFPFVYFVDNLDPEIFWELITLLNPKTTGIIAISKSGETIETLSILMRFIEYWSDFVGLQELGTHFSVITTPGSTLSKMARQLQLNELEHPPRIGGRFTCFTLVSLLPLIIVGGDPEKVRQGARYVVKNFFNERPSPPLDGSSVLYHFYRKHHTPSQVLMAYGDAFQTFTKWCCQIIAESLGKDGKGWTPLAALGPADHHSQLQLYLGGPRDKLYSLFSEVNRPREKLKPSIWRAMPELKFLSYSTLDDVLAAQKKASLHVLLAQGCFARNFSVRLLNEFSMGALCAHFILETLVLADLMDVNPLDQPMVESVKTLSKRFLSERMEKQFAPKASPSKKRAY